MHTLSRRVDGYDARAAARITRASFPIIDPFCHNPFTHKAPEPTQGYSPRLVLITGRHDSYSRLPTANHQAYRRIAFTIGQLAPIHQPGLDARDLRAGLHRARLAFLPQGDSVPGPARVNLIASRQPDQPSQSFVTHSLPVRASGVIERLFYILTPSLEATREAMSLGKRIG